MRLIEVVFSKRLNSRLTDLRPRLFRTALGLCGDPQQADDLVQVALEKALAGLHRLKQPESLEAWVFSILTNCHRDQCRRRSREEPIQEWGDAELPGTEEILDAEQDVQRVRLAIGCLNQGQREVLILIDIEGFSYAEVADILQIPIGTVMSRLNRARQRLKILLLEKTVNDLPRAKNHLERVK
jgi:RNA polymerase sigma-70 factor, ECF subfamily